MRRYEITLEGTEGALENVLRFAEFLGVRVITKVSALDSLGATPFEVPPYLEGGFTLDELTDALGLPPLSHQERVKAGRVLAAKGYIKKKNNGQRFWKRAAIMT